MKGVKIFGHSVRLVLNNLEDALRVSGLLYCTQAIGFWMAGTVGQYDALTDGAPPDPLMVLMALIGAVIGFVISLWIAVAWHRYVLKEEVPSGWVPAWNGDAITRYFTRSLMLGLILVASMAVLGVIAATVLGLFTGIVIVFFSSYLFFRLGLVLPAVALGETIPFKQAWSATQGNTDTFLALSGLVVAGMLALQIPTFISGGAWPVITVIYSFVVNWFATMIGISILTTLYGHFIEGRTID